MYHSSFFIFLHIMLCSICPRFHATFLFLQILPLERIRYVHAATRSFNPFEILLLILFINLQQFRYLHKEIRTPQSKRSMIPDKRDNILFRLLIVNVLKLFTQHSFNIR